MHDHQIWKKVLENNLRLKIILFEVKKNLKEGKIKINEFHKK